LILFGNTLIAIAHLPGSKYKEHGTRDPLNHL
jgi:hypothetical protein